MSSNGRRFNWVQFSRGTVKNYGESVMAFFTNEHKKLAINSSREDLQRGYAKSEEKLRQASKTGNERALKEAMKEHGNIEYAMLYQRTPEFQDKRKKYLRKNEFRFDTNPSHLNKKGQPHPAYITAKQKHMMRANSITHARTANGIPTIDINENPDKLSHDKRQTRISPPYWQNEKHFSKNTLPNFRFSNETQKQIKKINKKHK